MNLSKKILSVLICFSIVLTSFGAVFAEETAQGLPIDENGTYLIGTDDELFAFAELAKATAEADKAKSGSARTALSAKLTADIDLNPDAAFTYDHSTGFVTVANGDKSCIMGSGMKGTELGNFHPVYNGLCTWEQWNDETKTQKQLDEFRNNLIAQMDEKVEALGLRKWTPIGTVYPYIGTFDGGGHTIDGLYINDSSVGYTGLFGRFGDDSGSYISGELKNLTIGEKSLIVGYKLGDKSATGAFVGNLGFDTVSDCTNRATVVGKGDYNSWSQWNNGYSAHGQVGGITGLAFGKIQKCVNYGTIVSLESAAGIAGNVLGYENRDNSVKYCTNYGNVYAGTEKNDNGYAGGIAVNVGCPGGDYQFTKPLEACTNFGYVEGTYVGGIVRISAKGSILYCANRGTVSATLSAAGIVDYIYSKNGSFVMEGCYNAGTVSILSDNTTRKAYPIASGIYNNNEGKTIGSHTIKNCYNDKSVCLAEDGELFGTYITATDCFSVPTELFATGEPACKMGSNDKNGWRQNIPTPAEEGKTPEIYPTTNGTRRVYEDIHYCCHTDDKNKNDHKTPFYSNDYGNITDEHDLGANGICTHCGENTLKPIFLIDTLPEAKVGKYYSEKIYLSDSAPMVNGDIKATVSETDNTAYTFSHGLNGEADFSYSSKYYYYISGTPTEAGTLTFTLSATNKNGTTQKTYTLTIKDNPLEITKEEKLDNATAGASYWQKLSVNWNFDAKWAIAEGSSLPEGLTLSEGGIIEGTPLAKGTYTFTVKASSNNQTAQKTFTLVVFEEGGCKHGDTTLIKGTPATCQKDGVADYYHCSICDCDIDESGNELYNTDDLKSASNHSDKDNNGKCDSCGRNMPIFKKVTKESDIVYGGTYIFVTKIGDIYYALAAPPISEDGKSGTDREYTEFMNLCEITPKADGSFEFNELESKDAIMIKTEFAANGGDLDKGTPRYGLSSVFGGKRYGLSDGSACFEMYPNEQAKYGYRITLNENGAARIGSVYQEWWSNPETANNGILRAFDMTYNGENTKFMSLYAESYYNGEKADYSGAQMTKYPIYLYRMTDVGTTAGGITFISNDSNGTVSKTGEVMEILELTDDANLSNANGIANAVSQTVVETAIAAVEAVPKSVTAQIYADVTIADATAETDEKGNKTPTSVTYSVTPKIDIKALNGDVLSTSVISNDDLNGTPITVTLHTGGVDPEQIIHYKEDGTKEYFYYRWSDKGINGAKTFEYEYGFVTFTITDFSNFKILKTAEPEDGAQNSLNFDGKTITATVDKDGSYTVIFANYEKDGRLLNTATSVQSFKVGTNDVEIPENVKISEGDKVYLWSDLSRMLPACGPLEISYKK